MKYLITGITGSLGTEVTTLLTKVETCSVVGYSRDEFKQVGFLKEFKGKDITLYLGDVRDKERLIEASRGVNLIFHFAALKHVDKLEENPEEAISTNINGTMNVLHAQRVNKIPRIVLAATDKGAHPVNVYGATKLIAERLVLRNPANIVCRYGNVLASRGSVLANLVKTLKAENRVYLTDSNMTRFWITVKDAAHFVVTSAFHNGGLKIPPMKACPLHLLASATASVLGINAYQVVHTGMRAGEKIHECLRTEFEGEPIYSNSAPQFTESELKEIITPIVKSL
jgi:FlaA1/EpsC-like NDP-sugar epimerase